MGQGLPDKIHNARLSLEFQINLNFSISLSQVLQILSWDTVKKCLELNKSSSQPVTDGELMGKDPSSFAPRDNSEAVSWTPIPRIPWGTLWTTYPLQHPVISAPGVVLHSFPVSSPHLQGKHNPGPRTPAFLLWNGCLRLSQIHTLKP